MTEKLKQYIRDNVHLIDDNNYDEFFESCDKFSRLSLAEFLRNTCNIDPAVFMTRLPEGYIIRTVRCTD